jgi:GT2 family glycosyltransferase
MTFAIGIPTIAAPDALVQTVEAVLAQDVETDIVLIQNGIAVDDACKELESKNENVRVINPYFNMGCSASWNFACRWAWGRGHDKIMLFNDDFVMQQTDALSKIDQAIAEEPNAHYHFQGFTSVCIRRELWNKVGEFDEGFWPAYFEDNDYYQRSIKVGIDWKIVEIEKLHYNSLSLRRSPMLSMLNSRTFNMNSNRYVAKWGGPPHSETFDEPWNGQAPTVGNTRELMAAQGWNGWYF